MMISEYLASSPYARRNIDEIQKFEVRSAYSALVTPPAGDGSDIDWPHAFLCASAAALVPDESTQAYALRVATAALSNADLAAAFGEAAVGILEALGNRPALALARSRGYNSEISEVQLTTLQKMQGIRRRAELRRITNAQDLGSDPTLPTFEPPASDLNPFQAAFWDATQRSSWISASAPTSSGKSWLTREWISHEIQRGAVKNCVILLPTRALVEEVARDLLDSLGKSIRVETMPWSSGAEDDSAPVVYVFTQERLQLLFTLKTQFAPDLMFIDEAQSIEGGSRGVLLQQVIHRGVTRNPNAKVVFASPMSSNPGILLEGTPEALTSEVVDAPAVTVTQNLLFVESVKYKPRVRELFVMGSAGRHKIGTVTLPYRATTVPARLACAAYALSGETTGNIVYVNGAAEAEKVAALLAQLTDAETAPADSPLGHLVALAETTIHPRYALVGCLKMGIAFHYGNMPMVVRLEIERLFSIGQIKYLVCTSTLLEGVNLPCKSIYMRNPQRGRGNALHERDFWNLAGRAGRWGREFSGNIVCVDTDDVDLWPNLPVKREMWPLRRATSTAGADPTALARLLASNEPTGTSQALNEATISFMADLIARGEPLPAELDQPGLIALREGIEALLSDEDIFAGLISRNPGISPNLIKNLYRLFDSSNLSVQELALPYPEDVHAKDIYFGALEKLASAVTTAFGEDRRQHQLATLIVNWMRGIPLALLISYRTKARPDKSLSTNIREVMSDVENLCRFQAPRYLGLYNDVLRQYASDRGLEAPEGLEDIAIMLEMGVSRKTDISLVSMGISRSSAVTVGPLIADDGLDVPGVLRWFKERDVSSLDLPSLIAREVAERVAAFEARLLR
jgi:hypothetical protein